VHGVDFALVVDGSPTIRIRRPGFLLSREIPGDSFTFFGINRPAFV